MISVKKLGLQRGIMRAVRQHSDYKILATKRYELLRFLAGRKSMLALLCKQQQPRPSSETSSCLRFLFLFPL